MIPETYSDERLIHIIQINQQRLETADLLPMQRDCLERVIRHCIATLKQRGVDIRGLAA